ncbi:hypothetical protein [Maribacter sp. ACAM166]|uniref:hypothetical protein n=1 Tax=Maribacter sp. ACAM166 TaxID=2508996 RepID=UPI0010FE49BE|nr:hypothetical protein [Maribacter sp. ACAM166]TLP70632.1 hypothetical protein ES765_20575 [Maribacter sp. ACAM166]
MRLFQTSFPKLALSIFVCFHIFSCSKDADLLSEYVVTNTDGIQSITLLADDTFYIAPGQNAILMDVLNNDSFSTDAEVAIVSTSTPNKGDVTINEDNTLTYTPQTVTPPAEETSAPETTTPPAEETSESETTIPPAEETSAPEEDTFTYTTEVTTENTTTSQEATVTVNSSRMEALEELKAFPGAEGFGKNTTGGRGGIVVEVTNLNDSGQGSLRQALKLTGPRTIIFKVGGTIKLNSYLVIPSASGDVTIAGQTAPGDGILIANGELRIQASNVIVRYLRIRVDDNNDSYNADGIKIRSYTGSNLSDVIIDHCSVSWSEDENIAISDAENITIQNTITSEANYAFLMQKSENVSILNNLFALNSERNPYSNTPQHEGLSYEFVNNLVHGMNWGSSYASHGSKWNVIGNKYTVTSQDIISITKVIGFVAPNPANGDTGDIKTTHLYYNDLIYPAGIFTSITANDLDPYIFNEPYHTSDYAPTPASGLENKILAGVGASLPVRDAVDTKVINHYINGDGIRNANRTFPTIAGGNPYLDTDKDGISDQWEDANGLDKNDIADGSLDRDGNGYTNLEEFLFFLAL